MAKLVSEITLGIDVSKHELVIYNANTQALTRLENHAEAINHWLGTLSGPVRLAVEPTSHYHLALVEQAHTLRQRVYLVNARQLAHYRIAVGERNKTDAADAALLARYLSHEAANLRPFVLPDARAQRLWALIKRRGTTVTARQQLQQSLRDVRVSAQGVFREIRLLLARLDRQIQQLIGELGWQGDYQNCLTAPGLGALNAAALTAVFHRGAFASSDAFIAFIGMDIRLRESGRYRGNAKLTKCGESEIRRLLYCAAQGARSHPPFEAYYQSQLSKGLSKTAAKVALGRKLARVAFALMSQNTTFNTAGNSRREP